MNKPDETKAYEKVVKVINSCESKEQFDNACNMVHMFYKIFGNSKLYKDLHDLDTRCAYWKSYKKDVRMVFPFK